MRLAAALILILASSVTLADQPAGYTATDDLFKWRTSAVQPQRQPVAGFQTDTAISLSGVENPHTQVDGSDFLIWQRGMKAPVPDVLDTKEDNEGGM